MENNKRAIIGLIILFTASIALIVGFVIYKNRSSNKEEVGSYSNGMDSYATHDFVMGTEITLTLYGDFESGAGGAADKEVKEKAERIFESVHATDEKISWRIENGLIYKINKNDSSLDKVDPADKKEITEVTKMILKLCDDSEGALDITLRPVLDEWGIEGYSGSAEDYKVPDKSELEKAALETGYKKITVDEDKEAVTLDGVKMDFGSVGKGYALDKVYEDKFVDGNTGVVLSVGGSIMVHGSKKDNSDFKIGIRDPKGEMNDLVGYIKVHSGSDKVCISTSGSYEKYIDKDGKRYHHIIDPATLFPAESGLVSVTIVCDEKCIQPKYSGLISDGLSTACFILGKERSEKLLEMYNAEAIFIDDKGNITVTDGLKDRFVEE